MILLNGKEVKPVQFPNGETLINTKDLLIRERDNALTMKFQTDSDIITLIFVANYINGIGRKAKLIMPYVPYSRMDRTEGKTLFTLKYICKIINDLMFEEVAVYEPHSDVCTALLDRVKICSVTKELVKRLKDDINFDESKDFMYYPDSSAEKHFGKQFSSQGLVGLKHRDFETGKITKLDIVGDTSSLHNGFKAIMVDDLCSFGGTFMLGAKKLREMGAGDIGLVVTHCEENIFYGDILKTDLIQYVYTTDSMVRTKEDSRIQVQSL